jgi:hypothetical protein
MGTINDTLDELDKDTLIEYLQDAGYIVLNPEDMFRYPRDAVQTEVHLDFLNPQSNGIFEPSVSVAKCDEETAVRIQIFINAVRAKRLLSPRKL